MFARAKKKGALPRGTGGDKREHNDAIMLNSLMQAKNGRGRRVWKEEYKNIATSYGFPDVFETNGFERSRQKTLTDILERAKTRGSLPKYPRNDKLESYDADVIRILRKQKLENPDKWYTSLDDIAASYGHKNLFNVV